MSHVQSKIPSVLFLQTTSTGFSYPSSILTLESKAINRIPQRFLFMTLSPVQNTLNLEYLKIHQSPAINFILMPLNYDIGVMQAIELNDTIRKSAFSFINIKFYNPLYYTSGYAFIIYRGFVFKEIEKGEKYSLKPSKDLCETQWISSFRDL